MIYKVVATKNGGSDELVQYFMHRDSAEMFMLNKLDEGWWVYLSKITEADADEPMEVDP